MQGSSATYATMKCARRRKFSAKLLTFQPSLRKRRGREKWSTFFTTMIIAWDQKSVFDKSVSRTSHWIWIGQLSPFDHERQGKRVTPYFASWKCYLWGPNYPFWSPLEGRCVRWRVVALRPLSESKDHNLPRLTKMALCLRSCSKKNWYFEAMMQARPCQGTPCCVCDDGHMCHFKFAQSKPAVPQLKLIDPHDCVRKWR